MPLRCVGFTDYVGAFGAILIMNIILSIISVVITPLGAAGKIVITGIRAALGLYGFYMFWNMIGTVTGMRGDCPQGYHSGWPPIRGKFYHKDPATGQSINDPMPPMSKMF